MASSQHIDGETLHPFLIYLMLANPDDSSMDDPFNVKNIVREGPREPCLFAAYLSTASRELFQQSLRRACKSRVDAHKRRTLRADIIDEFDFLVKPAIHWDDHPRFNKNLLFAAFDTHSFDEVATQLEMVRLRGHRDYIQVIARIRRISYLRYSIPQENKPGVFWHPMPGSKVNPDRDRTE